MNLKPHEEKYWGIHCIENYGKRIIKLYRKRGEGGEDHTETRDFDPWTFNYPPVLIAASVFPRSKMS